jgi:hypothetical protein
MNVRQSVTHRGSSMRSRSSLISMSSVGSAVPSTKEADAFAPLMPRPD